MEDQVGKLDQVEKAGGAADTAGSSGGGPISVKSVDKDKKEADRARAVAAAADAADARGEEKEEDDLLSLGLMGCFFMPVLPPKQSKVLFGLIDNRGCWCQTYTVCRRPERALAPSPRPRFCRGLFLRCLLCLLLLMTCLFVPWGLVCDAFPRYLNKMTHRHCRSCLRYRYACFCFLVCMLFFTAETRQAPFFETKLSVAVDV